MASTVIAGKPSNTVGDKDSTLVLRGSSVKYLWGNKFIDLFKNGKINVEILKILKIIDSIDNIKDDGIYLIGEVVWAVIGGTKILLSGDSTTTYVSYLVDLKEVTPELKNRALTNIGFYYDTLEDAQNTNLTSGIIYIQELNKLYTIQEGVLKEYEISSDITEEEILQSLFIKEYSLVINDDPYITCQNNLVTIHKQLTAEDKIESSGATDHYGFRLYMKDGKSYLDIDKINERITENIEANIPEPIYTEANNFIIECESIDSEHIKCTFKYKCGYLLGDCIYVMLPIIVYDIWENGILTLTTPFNVRKNITIPTTEGEVIIIEGTNRALFLCIETYEIKYIPEKLLQQYKITNIDHNSIILEVPKLELDVFLKYATYTYLSLHPLISIENNNLQLFDTETIFEKENKKYPYFHTRLGVIDLEKEPLKTWLTLLEEVVEEPPRSIVGTYSDNLIGLNPIFYNTIFRSAGSLKKFGEVGDFQKFPEYENIKLPTSTEISQVGQSEELKLMAHSIFNQVVPNIEWIKALIDFAIPIGTIIAWSGNTKNIPSGWEVCKELEDRFIRAGTTNKQIDNPDISKDNKLTLKKNQLPKHTHRVLGETEPAFLSLDSAITTVIGPLDDDNMSSTPSKSVVGHVNLVSGGDTSHTHDIDFYSLENQTDNNSIKIEPQSYSLIFIKKIRSSF